MPSEARRAGSRAPRPPAPLFVALLALLVFGGVAEAQEVEVRARPAAGELVREGEAFAIDVALHNRGADERVVLVRAPLEGWGAEAGFAEQVVELPAGTRKSFTMLTKAPLAAGSAPLRVLDEDGAILHEVEFRLKDAGVEDFVIGVLGGVPLGVRALAADAPGLRVVELEGETLPRLAEGLDSLDLIAWAEPRVERLEPEQVWALAAWVARGGRLHLFVGETWQELAAGALAPLTSARARAPRAKSATLLEERFGLEAGPDTPARVEFVRFDLADRKGSPEGFSPEELLVAREWRGSGEVSLFGFVPSAEPFVRFTGIEAFWRGELERLGAPLDEEGWATSLREYLAAPLDELAHQHFALEEWSEAKRPRALTLTLGLLALGYLLVIGPLDYLVLRRFGRLTWTWLTFPLAVVVFTALVLSLGAAELPLPAPRHLVVVDALGEGLPRHEQVFAFAVERGAGDARLAPLAPGFTPIPGRHFAESWTSIRWREQPGRANERLRLGEGALYTRVSGWTLLSARFERTSEGEAALLRDDAGRLVSALPAAAREGVLLSLGAEGLLVRAIDGPLAPGEPLGFKDAQLLALGGELEIDQHFLRRGRPFEGLERHVPLVRRVAGASVQSAFLGERLRRGAEEASNADARIAMPKAAALHVGDWSDHLARGGGVLIVELDDDAPRVALGPRGVESEGQVVWRVLLAPDEVPR